MKIITTQGNSKLVEYQENGNTKRVTLPLDENDTSLGVPYGVPISLLLQKDGMSKYDADRIEQRLHNEGVWIEQDIKDKPGLIEMLNINLNQLLDNSVPNLTHLNWTEIQNTLSNLLISKELYTLEDIQRNNADFLWCIKTAMTKPIINLYRRQENVNR